MNSSIKKHKIVKKNVILLVIVLLFLISFLAVPYKANAATFHGIDITGIDSLDSYSLDFTVTQADMYYNQESSGGSPPQLDFFNRADSDVLISFFFPNVKIDGQSVFFSMHTNVNLPSGASYNVFNNFVRIGLNKTKFSISLTNNYYLELMTMPVTNFDKCHIMMYWKGVGNTLHSAEKISANLFSLTGVKFNVTAVPPGVVVPNDPNYNINFGNNGENTAPPSALPPEGEVPTTKEKSGWQKFLDMVSGFFGVSAIIAGVIVIGGGFILLKIIFK